MLATTVEGWADLGTEDTVKGRMVAMSCAGSGLEGGGSNELPHV